MESAIPKHLRRNIPVKRNLPKGHIPPFPAWSARFSTKNKEIVITYIGIQSKESVTLAELDFITEKLTLREECLHWEPAYFKDAQGYSNILVISYWPGGENFERWSEESGFSAWWNSPERENESLGLFIEKVTVPAERLETIFSDKNTPEGVAHLGCGMSDEIEEHGYWGSVRDRLPAAMDDDLQGDQKQHNVARIGKRVNIIGFDNLCLIRSGQDWSETQDEERRQYLQDVEPVLKQGMDFLETQGTDIGCLSCRYMQVLSKASGKKEEKTFGLAYFTSMSQLEYWAKEHATHKEIFSKFLSYVQSQNFKIKLKLYHEVSVTQSKNNFFEYINCHGETGLLSFLTTQQINVNRNLQNE